MRNKYSAVFFSLLTSLFIGTLHCVEYGTDIEHIPGGQIQQNQAEIYQDGTGLNPGQADIPPGSRLAQLRAHVGGGLQRLRENAADAREVWHECIDVCPRESFVAIFLILVLSGGFFMYHMIA
jgi:hypothetical protein